MAPQIRPLPDPPRCRGIDLGDGHYTGCAYGYGDWPPFAGPRDCPTCDGSGLEGGVTRLPHMEFGDRECCGCLTAILHGDQADITCNECNAIVRSVPLAQMNQTLTEMELTLDVASAICPHCESVNLFPGVSKILAYVCQHCGEGGARSPR